LTFTISFCHKSLSALFPLQVPAHSVPAAIQAGSAMNTDRTSANRTFPSFKLLLNESIQSILLNVAEVFGHAHGIPGSVTLVEHFQALTRVSCAFVTETGACFLKKAAVFNDTLQTTAGFMGVISAATGANILFSQVGKTNAAIHTTGGNQVFVHFIQYSQDAG
jgi:hypothetical protein